jgi:O-antigen/teichoic acid export membrane protein
LKTYLSQIASFLNYRIDIFLVNFFIGPAGAGIYTAAVRVAEQLWLISSSAAVVLLPRLAGLHAAKDTRSQLTPIVARSITLTGFGMAIALAAISDWIVPLAFGAEYAQSAVVLLWLLPGAVVYTLVMVISPDLAARGRPDLNAWSAGVALVVNVVGNLLLIPAYGIIGAALASTLSYVISGAITMSFYTRLSRTCAWDLVRVSGTDWRILRVFAAKIRGGKRGDKA